MIPSWAESSRTFCSYAVRASADQAADGIDAAARWTSMAICCSWAPASPHAWPALSRSSSLPVDALNSKFTHIAGGRTRPAAIACVEATFIMVSAAEKWLICLSRRPGRSPGVPSGGPPQRSDVDAPHRAGVVAAPVVLRCRVELLGIVLDHVHVRTQVFEGVLHGAGIGHGRHGA